MSQWSVSTTSKLGTKKKAMEQLASKTMETDSFILKPTLTDVSTPSSNSSSYLHHGTSYYIINLPKKEEKVNWQQTRRNSEFLGKIGKILPDAQRPEPYAQCQFKSEFGGFPIHQIKPKIAFWKFLPVYFVGQLEFLDLESIYPFKSHSPKIGSCGSKKW